MRLPDALRHTVRITGEADGLPLIDATIPLMDLLGKRLALSYEPFSPEDSETAALFGGVHATPPYLLDLRPVLKSGGVSIAGGTNPIGFGVRYTLKIEVRSPSGAQTSENRVLAGNVIAIGLGGRTVTEEQTASDKAAQILAREASRYLDRWNDSDEELADVFRVLPVRPIASVCLVLSAIDVQYAGGDPLYPLTFTWKGVAVDADRRSSAPVGVENRENERAFLSSQVSKDRRSSSAFSRTRRGSAWRRFPRMPSWPRREPRDR